MVSFLDSFIGHIKGEHTLDHADNLQTIQSRAPFGIGEGLFSEVCREDYV